MRLIRVAQCRKAAHNALVKPHKTPIMVIKLAPESGEVGSLLCLGRVREQDKKAVRGRRRRQD